MLPSQQNMENPKKPLVKSKAGPPPPVRQTLTSYKRMLKANPLLRCQEAGIDIDEIFKSRGNGFQIRTISEVSKASSILEGRPSLRDFKKTETKPLIRTQSLKLPKSNGIDVGGRTLNIVSGNKAFTKDLKRPLVSKSSTTTKSLINSKTEVTPKNSMGYSRVDQKKSFAAIKAKVNSFPRQSLLGPSKSSTGISHVMEPPIKCLPRKKTSSLRRSLSSGHIESKKGKSFDPKRSYTKSIQSQSQEELHTHLAPNVLPGISPIMEETSGRISNSLVFKTPSAYERRSICHFTPRSNKRSSLFQASTPAPVELQRLQERLNQWLKSRGKPLASFHHLRCFDVDKIEKLPSPTPIDEDKENIEVINETSESYEDLKIIFTPSEASKSDLPVKEEMPEEELALVAKEAMIELQKLIEEDYPKAQCLGWLELIRGKYKKAIDEPEYWECRAAIEQSVGNVGNALEFYKTAIIKGAEVTTVDKSLDQLLKKFSLLNISPSTSDSKVDRHKERIIREARNVFKSTIIQFAVQERKLKKKYKDETSAAQTSIKLVATPVRRSTRMSRSGYVSTPGVTLCTSLKEIHLSTEEIDFQKNKALC